MRIHTSFHVKHTTASRLPARSARPREQHDLNLQDCALQFDAKAAKGGAFQFEGYGSVWNRVDSYGDMMMPGCFAEAIKSRRPMMFFAHNRQRIPGKWLSYAEDNTGLRLTGELTPNHSEAADLQASIVHGSMNGLSVGGYTLKADMVVENDVIVGRKINQFDLYEVSPLGIPAEDQARIDGHTVKQALDECATLSDLEDLLREAAGFSKTTATAFVSRMRKFARGEPGEGHAATRAAQSESEKDLLAALRSFDLPPSLFGDSP